MTGETCTLQIRCQLVATPSPKDRSSFESLRWTKKPLITRIEKAMLNAAVQVELKYREQYGANPTSVEVDYSGIKYPLHARAIGKKQTTSFKGRPVYS